MVRDRSGRRPSAILGSPLTIVIGMPDIPVASDVRTSRAAIFVARRVGVGLGRVCGSADHCVAFDPSREGRTPLRT